ncbi:MAG: TlpA family protein disulfide reductase [Candidatus Dormibacteria bacterium]
MRRWRAGMATLFAAGAVAACGSTGGNGGTVDQSICPVASGAASCGPARLANLNVQPQNSHLLVGVNRISVALLDASNNPVSATNVTVSIVDSSGRTVEVRPLENIAAVYGGIPIYVGIASFPAAGQYDYVVTATGASGPLGGHGFVTVATSGPELAVGQRVPAVSQKVVTDPGVTLAMVDSGVPPDAWHDTTVAQALAAHRPMVLFFGQPGYCPSKTCGPTVAILEQLYARYGSSFSFQHIETDFPASAQQTFDNPAFRAFGLQSDPWVYLVNSSGIVADRFEGPVTLDELEGAAQGTLAGHVPAVTLTP